MFSWSKYQLSWFPWCFRFANIFSQLITVNKAADFCFCLYFRCSQVQVWLTSTENPVQTLMTWHVKWNKRSLCIIQILLTVKMTFYKKNYQNAIPLKWFYRWKTLYSPSSMQTDKLNSLKLYINVGSNEASHSSLEEKLEKRHQCFFSDCGIWGFLSVCHMFSTYVCSPAAW